MEKKKTEKKPHWSQTPKGRQRLSRAIKTAWKRRKAADHKKEVTTDSFQELHAVHTVLEGFESLTPLGKLFVKRHIG